MQGLMKARNPPVGLGLLQLLVASETEAQRLAPHLVRKANADFKDSDLQAKVVELVERLLMNRFPGLGVEEVRMKFKLHDIRKSKAWQELRAEGRDEGKTETKKELIQKWMARDMTEKQIAELLDISVEEVRRLAHGHAF
jgi:predicted transposase/invertase (TIGR01784 family)